MSRFPREQQYKLRTVFDGIDRDIYNGQNEALRPAIGSRPARRIAGVPIGPDTRVVTYVSRGMESMRGFDIFMRAAKLIARRVPDVAFIIVGGENVAYGGDEAHLGTHKTFKDWVLAQEDYDLEKFHFVGWQSPQDLAATLAATDLHIYLTVPFVLSWSMLNAMSCGAVVLGSSTTPVKEMIQDGVNGLLADFFNPQEFADKAVRVLQDPAAFRPLGRAAEEMINQRYGLEATLPQMLKLYEDACRQPPVTVTPPPPAPAAPIATPVASPASSDDFYIESPSNRAAGLMSDGAVVSKVHAPSRSPFHG
jgi:glycosyltransferase involved in cell wall biosynthesis